MIVCKELDKEFDNKEAMFKALKSNSARIISLKKATVKNSEGISNILSVRNGSDKSIEGLEDGFIYPIISNTMYMDSHKDVHDNGSMNKTVKEQQGKVHYALNHDLNVGKIIAYPNDVDMLMKTVTWKSLGREYEGTTELLMFKTNLQDYSPQDARIAIEQKLPVQNSISMIYKDIVLAVNSEDKDLRTEKKAYDSIIDKVANKEEVEKDGYLWIVKQLAIRNEGSMVTLGSNDVTPIIYTQPSNDTDKSEPSNDTQTDTNDTKSKGHKYNKFI